MKKIKLYIGFVSILALLLSGCSKEEADAPVNDPSINNTATVLSFRSVLNDLSNRAQSRSHFDQVPNCVNAEPAYAVLEISYPGQDPSTKGPITVDIKSDAQGYFTAYSELLKVPVANNSTVTVTLESFEVFAANNTRLWVAPKESVSGEFDGYVDHPLPYDFQVSDGTKPYIDVEVLCYDRRMANEYGYVFFDIDQKEIFNFCIFGNFCTPEGRHYMASYTVDVWTYDGQTRGDQIYTSEANNINSDGTQADPLCLALPDDPNSDDDQYWVEITIQSTDQYTTTTQVVRSGVLTELEAKLLFDENDPDKLEYYHFQVGCEEEDTPPVLDNPLDDTTTYYACLRELNDSNVAAIAYVSLTGSQIRTQIAGFNLDNGVHPQHIHGKEADSFISSCPDMSADLVANGGNGNGLLEIGEGFDAYGPPQLFLTTSGAGDGSGTPAFPTTTTGVLMYDRTVPLGTSGFPSIADMTPLDRKTIVLHGKNVSGQGYIGSLPVACGKLQSN